MHDRDFIKNSSQILAEKVTKKGKKARRFGGKAGDMPGTPGAKGKGARRPSNVQGGKSRGGRSDFA